MGGSEVGDGMKLGRKWITLGLRMGWSRDGDCLGQVVRVLGWQ